MIYLADNISLEFGRILTGPQNVSMSDKNDVLVVRELGELQCGDHISWAVSTEAGLSKHHAIFDYEQRSPNRRHVAAVIHVTGMSEVHSSSISEDRVDREPARDMLPAQVCKELLDLGRYIEAGTLFRYEYDETRCFGRREVMQRAERMIGKFPYHAKNHNCEHFALECKINDNANVKRVLKMIAPLVTSGLRELAAHAVHAAASTFG